MFNLLLIRQYVGDSPAYISTLVSSVSVKRGLRVFYPQNLGQDAQKSAGGTGVFVVASEAKRLEAIFGKHSICSY